MVNRGAQVAVQVHAMTFVLVNVMLVGIWAAAGGGYFWPIWPIIGWGPAVAFHSWLTYGHLGGD